jgi:hypothetical protein
MTNFVERRKSEVQLRRIPLLRTRVNISSGAIIPLLAASQPAGEEVGSVTVRVLVANIEGRVLVS